MIHRKVLQLDGQTISYLENGGLGADVVFLHGNSHNAEAFRRQLESPYLAHLHLVAFDLPGHGQSPPAKDPAFAYSLPGYSYWISRAIVGLGLQNLLLVGHSLGGHILLDSSAPLAGASGLVLMGTPPFARLEDMQQAFLPSPLIGLNLKPDLSPEEIFQFAQGQLIEKPENRPLVEQVINAIKETDPNARKFMGQSLAEGNFGNQVTTAQRFDGPIWMMLGEMDDGVNPAYLQAMIPTLMHKTSLTLMEEVKHCPHLEAADRFSLWLAELAKRLQ